MYLVKADEQAQQQAEALPADVLSVYAELRAVLEVKPWGGEPINDRNPDGSVRTMTFGSRYQGMVTYLVLDDQRRVDVLSVPWFGLAPATASRR